MDSDKRTAVVAALFEKKNKRKPKNSKELQDFVKEQGGEEFLKKVDDYISQAEAEQSKQAQKALHGAKLQYVKSLKNQCADDEELYYYKKGGVVNCGCKKKFLEGGATPRKDTGVTKFRLDLNKKKKENNTWTSQDDEHLLNARRKNGKNLTSEEKTAILKWNNLSLEQKSKYQLEEGKNGMKVKKDCGGSAIAKFKAKKGSKIKVSC